MKSYIKTPQGDEIEIDTDVKYVYENNGEEEEVMLLAILPLTFALSCITSTEDFQDYIRATIEQGGGEDIGN